MSFFVGSLGSRIASSSISVSAGGFAAVVESMFMSMSASSSISDSIGRSGEEASGLEADSAIMEDLELGFGFSRSPATNRKLSSCVENELCF